MYLLLAILIFSSLVYYAELKYSLKKNQFSIKICKFIKKIIDCIFRAIYLRYNPTK